jgi:hypothetical protein
MAAMFKYENGHREKRLTHSVSQEKAKLGSTSLLF